MANQPFWERDVAAADERASPAERKNTAQTRSSEASAATNEAQLPFVGEQAEATLANTRQTMTIAQQKAIDDLRERYEKNPAYVKYNMVAPALASALHTDENPAGDIALTYAAAKIFDPDSAVRDAEQAALGNTTNMLDAAIQRIKKEYGADDSGSFSPRARARLRAEIIRKTHSLNIDYNRVRVQYQRLANERGYSPQDVIGEHIGTGFMPQLEAYDRAHPRTPNAAPSVPEATSDQVGGEPIKGYRVPDETGAALTEWARTSPDFTVEEWARRATDNAVAASGETDVDREATYKGFLESAHNYFDGMTPEQRAKIPSGYDYSAVDEQARRDAGVGDVLLQAGRNLPESTVQLFGSIAKIPVDVISSVLDGARTGSVKTMTDLAGELITATGSDPTGPTMEAVGQMLTERYGGLDEIKNTIATDPVGLAGDISMVFTGGGTAAAKLPGMAGRVGEAIATTGRVIDPLSAVGALATEVAPRAASVVTNAVPAGTGTAVRDAATELVGLPSGVGGPALRQAVGAGFERGRVGAPTPGSAAFTENLRDPGANAEDIVRMAQDAVGALRQEASTQYQTQIARLGRNPAPLDINVVRQRMAGIRPRNYDAMLDAPNRPSSHLAWQQMNDTVEHYAAQAAQDPSLLEPLQMDQFKQDLFDVGSRIGGAYDRDAARIARTAYNGVRDELVRHDPIYAETMQDYERAAREAQQLEGTFSLAAARGKAVNLDSATRKLQSIMRNNANTNYGQRANLGDRLAELDPTGAFLPSLAGQAASSWKPRGLQSAVGTGVGTGLGLSGAASVPALVAAAPLFSPRTVGELAYGAGRAAGTGARVADAAAPYALNLADLYNRHPAAALGLAQTGSRLEGVENELAVDPNEGRAPSIPISGEASVEVDPITGDYILPNGKRLRKEDVERMQEMEGMRGFADGGPVYSHLERLARKYAGGGRVEPWYGDAPLQPGETLDHYLRRHPGGPRVVPRRARRAAPPPPGVMDRVRAALPTPGDVITALTTGGMSLPAMAADRLINPAAPGQLEPSFADYGNTIASAARQAPGGVGDFVGTLPTLASRAGEGILHYAANPRDIGPDIVSLGERYGTHVAQNPRQGAREVIETAAPFVGDVMSVRWAMQDAARRRAMGDIAGAEEIERGLGVNTGLMALPEVGGVAARGARLAPRVARALRAASEVGEARPSYVRAVEGPYTTIQREGLAPATVPAAAAARNLDELRALPTNPARAVANAASLEARGTPFEAIEPGTSLAKQGGIGRAFREAVSGNPAYEQALFERYGELMPDVVEGSGAQNYGQLTEAAYRALGDEVTGQFDRLPISMRFHGGEGEYPTPSAMLRDALGRGRLNVFQGGDPHQFLSRVDPATGLTQNEMFRAVHDYLGHGSTGSTFRPGGEEAAYAAHAQTMSPLARMALLSETRGQNSLVNYSPLNADIVAGSNEVRRRLQERSIAENMLQSRDPYTRNRAERFLADLPPEADLKARLRELGAGTRFAEQNAVLLPPEYLDPMTQGGTPDWLREILSPEGTSARGVHISTQPDLEMLDPAFYGSGHQGAEYRPTKKLGLPNRSYLYSGPEGTVRPEAEVMGEIGGVPRRGARYAYEAQPSGMYDLQADPENLVALSNAYNLPGYQPVIDRNLLDAYNITGIEGSSPIPDIERLTRDYGYGGYLTDRPGSGQRWAAMFDPVTGLRRIERGPGGYAEGGLVDA